MREPPNTEQAWCDGFDAFAEGKQPKDNPYSAFKASQFDAWNLGWLDGRDAMTRKKRPLPQPSGDRPRE